MHSLREMMHSLRASPVFVLALLLALAAAAFNGLAVFAPALIGRVIDMSQMHFVGADHRTHDLTFGLLFVPAVVGILAQFRRPAKNISGQLMALIPSAGLLLTLLLTLVLVNNANVLQLPWVTVMAPTLIATSLHPAGRDFFRSFSVSQVNPVMLALVIIAAVPLLAFASTNIGLQRIVTDDHAALGHYGFMAAFSFTVIAVGVLASLRADGWRLTAWVAGLLPALLGLTSVIYPDASSSLGLVWALAAIAWGAMFVAAAELTKDAEFPTLLGSRGVKSKDDTRVRPDRGPTISTPRLKNVIGGIALVVVLLPVILFISGDLGGHTPPGGAGTQGDASPVADGAVEIAVIADNFTFDPDEITVTTGDDVAIVLTSVDILHDFVIDELDANVAAERGETATWGFRADRPGRYTFYCSVPGHRQAGMEGTLIVDGPEATHIPPEGGH